MKGFDYKDTSASNRGVDRPVAEWRATMSGALADGGRRRVSDGETFIHDKHGRILVEIYGNVAVTKDSHGAD